MSEATILAERLGHAIAARIRLSEENEYLRAQLADKRSKESNVKAGLAVEALAVKNIQLDRLREALIACRERLLFELLDTYGGLTEGRLRANSPDLEGDWRPHLEAVALAKEALEGQA